MKLNKQFIEELKTLYEEKNDEIKKRIHEFKQIYKDSDDNKIFEELTFCILSSGVGPKVAAKSLDNIRSVLTSGNEKSIFENLKEVHKYPERSSYLITTREYLKTNFNFKLKDKLESFTDRIERRDFIATNKNIKGIGYLQASHFLRNIGYSGYAILDKNIVKMLNTIGIIEENKPPTTRNKYLKLEESMMEFADYIDIDIDELDLLLWCRRTGYIPR